VGLWAWLICYLTWVITIRPDNPISYLGVMTHIYTIIWMMIPFWVVNIDFLVYIFWGLMPGSLLALIGEFYLYVRTEHESILLYSLPMEIGAPIGIAYTVFFLVVGTIYLCCMICGDEDGCLPSGGETRSSMIGVVHDDD
jgi:hypothetical protein